MMHFHVFVSFKAREVRRSIHINIYYCFLRMKIGLTKNHCRLFEFRLHEHNLIYTPLAHVAAATDTRCGQHLLHVIRVFDDPTRTKI
jgi:hypothetical protein